MLILKDLLFSLSFSSPSRAVLELSLKEVQGVNDIAGKTEVCTVAARLLAAFPEPLYSNQGIFLCF